MNIIIKHYIYVYIVCYINLIMLLDKLINIYYLHHIYAYAIKYIAN